MDRRYIIVTPAKNESEFIEKTFSSVLKQTVLPTKWIIVDDESDDNSYDLVKELSKDINWVQVVKSNIKDKVRTGGSKVVQAFNVGYKLIENESFEYIVKLDADLILPENYFELMLHEFENDEKLGICGGVIVNKISEKEFVKEKVADFHVRGALKMIRIGCWNQIGGFKEIWNWDGLDIMEAMFNGWKTKSLDVEVIHLRPTTGAYNKREHAFRSGYEAYKMGSSFFLTILRAIALFFKKPFAIRGCNYFWGYLKAGLSREPLIISKPLADFINKMHLRRIKII